MPNKHRVAALGLISVLVLNPGNRAIADPATEPENGKSGLATEIQTKSSNASGGDTSGESEREVAPAEPFIPSESVSADSAVSFPVDI